jgi:hypothetical protein
MEIDIIILIMTITILNIYLSLQQKLSLIKVKIAEVFFSKFHFQKLYYLLKIMLSTNFDLLYQTIIYQNE